MGERAVPPQQRLHWWQSRSWTFWLLPALLGLLVVLVPLRGGVPDAGEVTTVLLAQSLARDFDAVVGPEDEARVAAWREKVEALPVPRQVGNRYESPLAAAVVLVPAAIVGGYRLLLLWQSLLFVAGALLAARTLSRRMGSKAGPVVALFLFGSVAFAWAFRLWPESALLPLVMAAFALLFGTEDPVGGYAEEIYGGRQEWGTGFVVRSLVVGGLLGVVVATEPLLAPLLLATIFAFPAKSRARGAAGVLGGAAVVVAIMVLAGASPALDGPASGIDLADGGLWLWQLVYLVVGRHGGKLFYLAPLLLLLSCGGYRRGRWAIVVAAAVALAAVLVWRPFDGAGFPETIGHSFLVLLYPALWFQAEREPPRLAIVGVTVLAAAFLWPLWISPWRSLVDDDGRSTYPVPYLSPWAPVETTWRGLPAGPRIRRDEVTVRLVNGPVWDGEGQGELLVMGNDPFELLVGASRPIGGLRFEGDEPLGAEVEIWGELGETVLRPDRSVEFLVRPGASRTVHSAPGFPGRTVFYRLRMSFADARHRPVVVRLTSVVPLLEGDGS